MLLVSCVNAQGVAADSMRAANELRAQHAQAVAALKSDLVKAEVGAHAHNTQPAFCS